MAMRTGEMVVYSVSLSPFLSMIEHKPLSNDCIYIKANSVFISRVVNTGTSVVCFDVGSLPENRSLILVGYSDI